MNRKITNRFFAGLCISIGLMACTQNLEQERYSDLIVGLEGDEITLYPLGDRLTLPVISVSEWQIIDKPEWLGCTKTDNAIELSVGLNEVYDNDGKIIIQSSDANEKYIQVSQETLCFNLIDKNGVRLENNEKVGNELDVEVEHNVFYGFDAKQFRVDTIDIAPSRERYHISSALEDAFNAVQPAEKEFKFYLLDKEKKKTVKEHSITFMQDVFYFYFEKQNDEYVMSKRIEVGFVGETYSYTFVASEEPEFDAPVFAEVENIVPKGNNNYEMKIKVPQNTGSDRNEVLCFYTETYQNKNEYVLLVEIKQKGQPKVELKVGDETDEYELLDTEDVMFEINVNGTDYSQKAVLESSTPGVIEIKDNKIVPKSIGQTSLTATVTVDGVELHSNKVNIKVVREYSTGSGEEIGDDTVDEW